MNSELSSRSTIRSLRQLQKIDYKKMNNAEEQTQQGSDKKSAEILENVGVGSFDENPLGASGTSTGLSEPKRGQVLDPSTGFLIIVLGSLGDLIPEGRSNAYATPTRPRDI